MRKSKRILSFIMAVLLIITGLPLGSQMQIHAAEGVEGAPTTFAALVPDGTLSVKSANFPTEDLSVDSKVFPFVFSNDISVAVGKEIMDSISISPAVSIKSAVIDSAKNNTLIVTLDETLSADTKYTLTIDAGFFSSPDGLTNDAYNITFHTAPAEPEGPITADEFIGLTSDDKYVIAGNFQKIAGETVDWAPTSKVTQMKRVTGDLYAYSVVLPASQEANLDNNEAAYQFKIVKNGNYDDPDSFSGGTGGYSNYEFTLDAQQKLTFFINTETHKMAVNTSLNGKDVQYYYYSPSSLPKLTGDIQTLFGEAANDLSAAKQTFYDYYFDKSDYRLERKLGPTDKDYTAKAETKQGIIGQPVTLNKMSRAIDTIFKINANTLSMEYNIFTPVLSMTSVPSVLQKGTSHTFAASFQDEFKDVNVLNSGVSWSLKAPVEGITLSSSGEVSIGSSVPDATNFTIVASYSYKAAMDSTLNKTYTAEAVISVAEHVTSFKFNYLRHNKDYDDWNLWVWLDGKLGSAYDVLKENDGWYSGVVSIPEAVSKIYFIARKGEWSDQDGRDRILDLSKGTEVWVVEGENEVYYNKEYAIKPRISTAVMNTPNQVAFSINGSGKDVNYSNFTLKVNNKSIPTTSAADSNKKGIITLMEEIKPWDLVQVIDKSGIYADKIVTMRGILDDYYYSGTDLGYTKNDSGSSFKVWAPTASKVSLALYKEPGNYTSMGNITDHTPDSLQVMQRNETSGVWSSTASVPSQYKYYMYKVEFPNGTQNYAIDPYAKSVSANGQRTAIVDVNSVNPTGWNPNSKPAGITYPTDQILYELQVRDFSLDPAADFKYKGKFKAFTETGLTDSKGNSIGIDHLKELGITTVHLMPSYDFGEVNELMMDDPTYTGRKYNWGYDPQNYNVPEGSFSTNPADPKARVLEFKEMVQALHNAGIRVVMDVVYNHTSSIDAGPFQKIVPDYYYRLTETGEYSNGSGCGNEVASENPMVRKYIIDSVKYWAKEYNVDGFRFDLFGLIDQKTASQLTKELKDEIDPSIIVYGEPWAAGSTPIGADGVAKGSQKDQGYAVFNDNIRGAIKGGSDDTSTGFATGDTGKEGDIVTGICGSIDDFTNSPTETVNYVTAHDNLNLWDKIITTQNLNTSNNMLFDKIKDGVMLDGSSVDDAVAAATPYADVDPTDPFSNETVKRSILANSMILTMQGVPFIHSGDEFLRSKYGDHNSYRSPDSVNMIRWENKTNYKAVTDYYAGLIELRKTHPAFRMNTKQALQDNLVVLKQEGNIVTFVLKKHANGDTWNNIVVIYNANDSEQSVNLNDYDETSSVTDWNIAVNGSKAGCESLGTTSGKTVQVPSLSMVVLYDEATPTTGTENCISSIEVIPDKTALAVNESTNVQVVYKNKNGSVLPTGHIEVKSDDASIAEVAITDTNNYSKIKITGKAAGKTNITLTAKDESASPAKEIVKKISVEVVGVKAAITPEQASYRENPVITVDTADLDIASITANLQQVGGSKQYEVSKITKQVSFAIKDYIKSGVKTIPITITDKSGKKYTTEAQIQVTPPPANGFDWDESLIYFMVTDRFNDGNPSNNGGLTDKSKPGSYHGGDFAGVTQKLDYLKDLGVNTIWITPIVENVSYDGNQGDPTRGSYYSYDGYWATDFTKLNPYLGTKDELHALIDQAHDSGMKIMVDVVLNHAGYFDVSNPLADVRINPLLRPNDDSISDNDEISWISGLPDFKTEDQSVRSQIIDWQTAWASLKTNRGDTIDYYRVDTVKHVDHETWTQFKTALASNNSSFKLIGAISDSDAKIQSYLNNGQMDSALDFSFKDTARRFVKDGELEEAELALEKRNGTITNTASLGQFLSSHDDDGFLADTLKGDKAKMMAAASLQLTAKGQPVIYYGEEIGASGANNWPVFDNRKDFDWDNANADNQMLTHYKKLLAARNKYSKVFAKGGRRKAAGSDDDGYLVFARTYRSDEIYVGINTANIEQTAVVKTGCKEGVTLTDLYSGKHYMVDKSGNITITIPAMKDGGTVLIPTEIPWNTGDPDIPSQPGNNTTPSKDDEDSTTVKENKDGSITTEYTSTITQSDGTNLILVVRVTKKKDGTITNTASLTIQTAAVSMNKKTANIDIVLDKNLIAQIEKLTANKEPVKITINLPENVMIKQLNETNTNAINLNLTLAEDSKEIRTEYVNIKLPKAVINAAKKAKKDITVTVKNSDQKVLYSYFLDGDFLAASKRTIKDMNVSVLIVSTDSQKNAKKLIVNDKNNKSGSRSKGIMVQLKHTGLVPATAKLKLYTGAADSSLTGIHPGGTVYLYYYNEKTKKLDVVPNNKYKVTKDGYVTIYLTHASNYVLLPKAADKKITTSLLDQIAVTTKKAVLYTSGSSKKISIKQTLPSTLLKVSAFSKSTQDKGTQEVKFTYQTSNSKIASVSKYGVVTAKKSGKVTITITAALKDGSKKTFKAIVTVKKAK